MTLNRRKALQLAGSSTLLAMPFVQRARAEDKILNVYNWADYIGETTIEDFQKATGIAVTYDTYSSTDEMQAKMLAGSTGYDVVDMAGISLSRFVAAKIYQKIDRTKLPNWKNLDPVILNILEGFDPGIQYSMPYMWGSVGFTYNVDMVKERIPDADLDSMDLVMKPELAQKLSDCGISWLDEPTDTIMLLLDYLGKPRNVYAPADMDAVVEAFKKIRSTVRTFDSTNYLNALPNSELCVANNWSGDYSTAKARRRGGRQDQSRVFRAEDRRARLVRRVLHPGRCQERGKCPHLPQLHDGARGYRQVHQLHQLRQREPCLQGLPQSGRSGQLGSLSHR